jgi:hypothetical protein
MSRSGSPQVEEPRHDDAVPGHERYGPGEPAREVSGSCQSSANSQEE